MKASRPGQVRAVIFDWSGVLVDEIDAVADAHISAMLSLGGRYLTTEEWKRRVSRDWTDIYLAQGIAPRDVKRAVERFEYFYSRNIRKVQLVDGALELLQGLKDLGVHSAILSNQFESCVLVCAAQYELSKYFDTIVAARGTQIPKNDLESGRKILRLLDVAPYETLLIDDMEEGIELGNALGLITVGMRSVLRRDLKDADLLINKLPELLDIVRHPDLQEKIKRDLSLSTAPYREVYERREKDKAAGRIRRLPDIYHAENAALVRFVGRKHRNSGIRMLVDVGCGASNHAIKAASLFGCKVIRLDLTLTALQRTVTLNSWRKADPGVTARIRSVQADAARLPLRDKCSDMTFCTELLEHVVAPQAVLNELARITRPGGRLIVAAPNALSETARPFRSLLTKSYHSGHVREYTLDSMVDQVDRAGFDVLWAGTRWFLFYYLAFSLERQSKPGVGSLLLAKVPLLTKLMATLTEPAILCETIWFGARSKRGLGLLIIAVKR